MKPIFRAIESKLIMIVIVYFATMFVPWREIYKGTSAFTVLPLWWEYGNPIKNYLSIAAHITLSIIIGLIIYTIMKLIKNKMCSNKK